MRKDHPAIAKITRPTLPDISPRKRLYKLMDQCRRAPVTWISGPPGSGKTTLVCGYLDARRLPCLWYQVDEGDDDIATFFYYMGLAARNAAPGKRTPLPLLTSEYLLGISTFTKRYFENLYARLKPPYAIAFDNYQDVPAQSPFHEIIQDGLSMAPQGIHVLVMSRGNPPPAMARLRAGDVMETIGWEELRLTPDESRGIVKLHTRRIPPKETVQQLHEKTEGWAAGLVLLTKGTETREGKPRILDALHQEEIFDYFAGEIFDKLDGKTRDFLLTTAFLPRMTVQTAKKLTGQDNAVDILSGLSRNNFFTEKRTTSEPIYQYHPLFREFLLMRIKKSLRQEGILSIEKQAAALLEETGQIEDAAEIYLHAREWAGLTGLVLKHAPELMKQGRAATVGRWLAALPEDMVSQNPWLQYWSGVCLMLFNPRESQHCFEKTFHLFKTQKDAVGTFLAWAGIVNSISYAMDDMTRFDHWIAVLDQLLCEFGTFPSPDIEGRVANAMITALVLRQPDHPSFDSWKAKALPHEETNIYTLFQLAFYYVYRGDVPQAEQMRTAIYRASNVPGASPLGLIFVKLIDTVVYNVLGPTASLDRIDKCIQAAREGLEIAEKTGVHIMDSLMLGNAALAALSFGDLPSARSFMQRMADISERQSVWEKSQYHMVLAFEALQVKEADRALFHAEVSLRYSLHVGAKISIVWAYYVAALVRYELGDIVEAQEMLEKGHRAGKGLGGVLSTAEYLSTKAYFALRQGDKASARSILTQVLPLGREMGIFSNYILSQAVMLPLCIEALEADIEVEYVQLLIRKQNLIPETPPLHIVNWPWAFKVYTLGRFGLLKDGKPVAFSGKVRKKPLEMLKLLIACGGREISDEQITEALWPDAEGDAAHQSFETTLHRLRELIGIEQAIERRGGRVTLDPRYWWVDVWAFERMFVEAESPLTPALSPQGRGRKKSPLPTEERIKARGNDVQDLEKAINIYRGRFLAGDGDKPWLIPMRERLQSRFIRLVARLGGFYERSGQWDKAVECYERALDVDDLAEEFYQRLMICHQHRGRPAGAVKVYNRCKTVLAAAFGIEPPEEMEAMYRTLTGKSSTRHRA